LAVAARQALSASPLCSFGFTNAADPPVASVAAEIGTIAQFSGVADGQACIRSSESRSTQ
jgi:hypothetical protein